MLCSIVSDSLQPHELHAACQPPASMGISKQEYWSGLLLRGLLLPPPEDLPDPGIKPSSPALAGRFFATVPPRKPSLEMGCELYKT